MKIIELNPLRPSAHLNMRQLLNPIFFAPVVRHPDHKRQRCARLRARSLRQARELKALDNTWVPKLSEPVVGEFTPFPFHYCALTGRRVFGGVRNEY